MNTDRLKFRVWDAWKKTYRYDLLVGMDGCLYEWGNFQTVEFEDKDRFFAEQCTGVQDKNGKLIYDGDVVRTVWGSIGIVTWRHDRFLIKSDNGINCTIDLTREIIGNIHGNGGRDGKTD